MQILKIAVEKDIKGDRVRATVWATNNKGEVILGNTRYVPVDSLNTEIDSLRHLMDGAQSSVQTFDTPL